MQIAILGDLHGNSEAVATVLARVDELSIRELIVLGDIVGYYYAPHEILVQLDEFDVSLVRGNHEDLLGESLQNREHLRSNTARYGSGLRVAIETLGTNQIERLVDADKQIERIYSGKKCLFTHASPWDTTTHIYEDCNNGIRERLADSPYDMIFLGHAHYQFEFRTPSNRVINPGSVGQNRHEGSIAQWATLDTDSLEVQFHSTPYDSSALIHESRLRDPEHPYLVDVLTRKP